MLASTLPSFHHWLLGGKRSGCPSVILSGFPHLPPSLAPGIARYLNEYHDEGAGRWIAFAPELIRFIAANQAERVLLGVPDLPPQCPPTSPGGLCKVLAAIVRRGHAVLEGPLAVEASADHRDVFRSALGVTPENGPRFHLTLRPELFSDRALPSIISDTFLEWEATRGFADTV